MDTLLEHLAAAVILGAGATAMLDLWAIARARLFGATPPNYAFVGRWFGHMPKGRFFHAAIARAAPIPGELALGWGVHYAVGVAFAAVLLAGWGLEWARQPTIGPALAVGITSVAAPFLLMQPAMGAGFAARKTPRPNAARLQSLVSHAVFGFGLFFTGWIVSRLSPA